MTDPTAAGTQNLVLPGPWSLSPFRRAQILAAIARRGIDVTQIEARYIHFAAAERTLHDNERDVLSRILAYPGEATPRRPARTTAVLVTPRIGTRSPWSSKATDIAHRAGLTAVRSLERGVQWFIPELPTDAIGQVVDLLYDRMTESWHHEPAQSLRLFETAKARPCAVIALRAEGRSALEAANRNLGLALNHDELTYLANAYGALERDPTDAELMMFAQANSEHCRHKIFNSSWRIDGEMATHTLFEMIRHTHAVSPARAAGKILSAYSDNAAVIAGTEGAWFAPGLDGVYRHTAARSAILMKVETHNHPTAISPYPGAATGSGGEIRDEGATGRGSKAKAGLVGFTVSNLRIPDFEQPWEQAPPNAGGPTGALPLAAHLASPLQIMLDGPIGAASFNNEFGRPAVLGYFRTYEQHHPHESFTRGYHKPIMLAGGLGAIRPELAEKRPLPTGTKLIVLGGPAMLIGLGGGAASSLASGQGEADLDFASVQRDNPEMQRRCQEVIDRCVALGPDNPILSIHDVGAGGLSNALPELVHADGRGGHFNLRAIPNAEPGMSPMEIWSNEAQERYVLGIAPTEVSRFAALCERERCPYAVVGEVTETPDLVIDDAVFGRRPVDIPMDLVLGSTPRLQREARRALPSADDTHPDLSGIELSAAVQRVLRLPVVADKTFLVTIGDRTVGGMIARDQMVGPWQVPVADCAVTINGFDAYTGEAMALGERSPLAVDNAPASGRMAVGEALTNLAAAPVTALEDVVLSANWMAACGDPVEDAALFDTVRAVGMELCPRLGIAIPVGKDSLSMRARWDTEAGTHEVRSPVSLVVSAFAPVDDVRRSLTPELRSDLGPSELLFIDLAHGATRLGGCALSQVFSRFGGATPDVDHPESLAEFFGAVQSLNRRGLLLAYHDRSDGGLFTTVCEMSFAGRLGLSLDLSSLTSAEGRGAQLLSVLFNEELGAVVQVRAGDAQAVRETFEQQPRLRGHVHHIGTPSSDDTIEIRAHGRSHFEAPRASLHRTWSETSYRMARERDNPSCAEQAFAALEDVTDPGLSAHLTFSPWTPTGSLGANPRERPRVAILREQGVNGQVEMAAAFDRAGFEAIDVHMSDIVEGRESLAEVSGLVACGGFSYGDVLGAGGGWASSIRFNDRARARFEAFFARPDSFTLGVCNGCQMLAHLQDLIPGAQDWPRFVGNRSQRFESRLVLCEVPPSPSIMLGPMAGSRLPTVIAHGEGRATFVDPEAPSEDPRVCLRYIDHHHRVTNQYPFNPNGSPAGVTGITTDDGRVTIMMPHPERLFRTVQHSWHPAAWNDAQNKVANGVGGEAGAPESWGEDAPWLEMFRNARRWIG